MTERTDQLLIDAFSKAPPRDFSDLQVWRDYREDMHGALRLLDKRLEDADRNEYEALQTRLKQLQARLGARDADDMSLGIGVTSIAPAVKPIAPSKPHNPVSETDWGQGIGGREKPIDPAEFRQELADLRDRTTEKRARRGAA